MKYTRVSFIGCGNMGLSLIGGLIANGHEPSAIRGADPNPVKRQAIADRFGIELYADNVEAIIDSEVIVLAVKPQMMAETLSQLASHISQAQLLISIAAGIRLDTLGRMLGDGQPVVRVMPNTPALISAGASALYANSSASPAQKDLAEGIMRAVGLAVWLDSEAAMDTVTALSGSGPAYFFLVMEVMEKAAIRLGLPANQARLLTLETAFGAAKMALESGVDAATLRRQVTSPGGTTEQALKVLMEQGDIEQVFLDALAAAKNRSEELALSLDTQT
jgi:pyrroline-5-carboxylate reductase